MDKYLCFEDEGNNFLATIDFLDRHATVRILSEGDTDLRIKVEFITDSHTWEEQEFVAKRKNAYVGDTNEEADDDK